MFTTATELRWIANKKGRSVRSGPFRLSKGKDQNVSDAPRLKLRPTS